MPASGESGQADWQWASSLAGDASAEAISTPISPGAEVGPYQILGEIGRGGMGAVYRAQDAAGTVVALKLLLADPSAKPRTAKRFQAEVSALSRLQHRHVVSVLGSGQHQGRRWLALEFIEGDSLQRRLRYGPLPIDEAVRVAHQLALALGYVHACGVLHRDLKPDNVLLKGEEALLTDFGLVLDDLSSQSRLTATGAFLGTPGYWSPEQARGETKTLGPATDIYGLGAVLYACLTGQPPVQAKSLQECLSMTELGAIATPRRVRPEVPASLSELCMRCLAPAPQDRPRSADEVARALLLAGAPTEADDGARVRGSALIGAAAVGLAVLALAGLAAVWNGRATPPTRSATAEEAAPPPPPTEEHEFDEEIAPLDADAKPGSWLAAGQESYRAGRHAEAVHAFTKALEENPDRASTYLSRAVCLTRLERYAEAIADCDRALELNPREPFVHANRGACKANLGDHDAALEDFAVALEINPRDTFAQRNLALSLLRLGRWEAAIAAYDPLIQRAPDAASYYRRGVCKTKLGRFADAIADYDRAIEESPEFADAWAARGSSKTNLERYAAAVEDLDRALELNPKNAVAYLNRGGSKASLQDYAGAVADFDRALQEGLSPPLSAQAHQLRERAIAQLDPAD